MSDPDLSREELLAALAQRDAVIAGLLAEIERLKRRVGMDSSNSSLPPGSDRPAARAKRAKRKKGPSPRRRAGTRATRWSGSPTRTTSRCWSRTTVSVAEQRFRVSLAGSRHGFKSSTPRRSNSR